MLLGPGFHREVQQLCRYMESLFLFSSSHQLALWGMAEMEKVRVLRYQPYSLHVGKSFGSICCCLETVGRDIYTWHKCEILSDTILRSVFSCVVCWSVTFLTETQNERIPYTPFFSLVPPAYSFSWINSCEVPGRGRTEIPAHPGMPRCSHWGTEKREWKDSETFRAAAVVFLQMHCFECYFTCMVSNCPWRRYLKAVAIGAWVRGLPPALSWISSLDAKERKLLSKRLIWWRAVLPHKPLVSRLWVTRLHQRYMFVHLVRLWCF